MSGYLISVQIIRPGESQDLVGDFRSQSSLLDPARSDGKLAKTNSAGCDAMRQRLDEGWRSIIHPRSYRRAIKWMRRTVRSQGFLDNLVRLSLNIGGVRARQEAA